MPIFGPRCVLCVVCIVLGVARCAIGGDGAPQAALRVSPDAVNFGDVAPEDGLERTVTLTNKSTTPVQIKAGTTSCTCTEVLIAASSVDPGGSVDVTVRLKLRDYPVDDVHTRVTLETDDPHAPEVVIPVNARILPEFTLDPERVDFGTIKRGRPAAADVTLRSTEGNAVKLLAVKAPKGVTATFQPIEGEETAAPTAYRISVQLDPSLGAGPFRGQLELTTDVARAPKRLVPLSADLRGFDGTVQPRVMVFEGLAPGAVAGTYEIASSEPFAIAKVESTGAQVVATADTQGENKVHRVRVAVAQGAHDGDGSGKIRITILENGVEEVRELPWFGSVRRVKR